MIFKTNSYNSLVDTNINYTYNILQKNIADLKNAYSFLQIGSIGKSVLGKDIPYIKIGNGPKEIFYSASYHANEWITSPVLMKFVEDYCFAISQNTINKIQSYDVNYLFSSTSLYIVPMVNPDGVDLVTGGLIKEISELKKKGDILHLTKLLEAYSNVKQISYAYPSIPFPNGWKANIEGVDLNLQFPANWQDAKQIKYSQGYTSPAPRDFVGYGPLTEPESLAIYNFTLLHDFNLVIAYHTQGKEIYWQFKNYADELNYTIGLKFAQVSGYTLSDVPYNSSFAGYKDWFLQQYQKPAYTVEAGFGENPLPISQFNEIYKDNFKILLLGLEI